MKIIGYGVCGKEADRYLEATLKEFKRLCDDTIIVLNNATSKEEELIASYGFKTIVDNREWGLHQHNIKQDLMLEVAKLNPDYCVCLDMDEVFDQNIDRAKLLEMFEFGDALYVYIVNLWNDGWNRKWSFWNIRAWKWTGDTKFENKPLHCGLAPAWCYRLNNKHVPIFVKHYGLMKKADRQKKIERYQKYDPQAKYKDVSYYNALSSDEFEELNEQVIRDAIIKEIGIQEKKPKRAENKAQYYYVKSPQGKIIDIPSNLLDETLNRGFTLVSEVGGVTNMVKKDKYRIAYIGKFKKLWDEEYIARSFEGLGHTIQRIEEGSLNVFGQVSEFKPDFVLVAKLNIPNGKSLIQRIRSLGLPVISWIFDLYWDYTRENQIGSVAGFDADIVITTDGGHQLRWANKGIKHFVVRQGIYKPECYIANKPKQHNVAFIGSANPSNVERNQVLELLERDFNLQWFGKQDTNAYRSTRLNDLLAECKIVVGDSVYSPHYWSNRVVETLGRGGFLIHREVEGLKEEYPYLVTYTDYNDLKTKIQYYLDNPKEREEIMLKNFNWVKSNYTCDKKCNEIIKIYEQNCNK